MKRPISQAVGLVLLTFYLAVSPLSAKGPYAQAAGAAGAIDGVVADPSGAGIGSAQVEMRNPITGYSRKTLTDPQGAFHFTNVPMNDYHLEISASGFQSGHQDVNVRSVVPQELKIQLSLASSNETVTVEASGADLLEPVPSVHTDADLSLIQKLPLTSSSQGLSDAITLATPGVVADSNGSFHPLGDHSQTSFVVDGQPITDQQSKTFSTEMPANAFQSLELISAAPNAEYGDKTSLVVNAVTRSGLGQPMHGSLDSYYGSFGTFGEDATLSMGGPKFGNFFLVDTSRSARFLDSPEFTPFHDKGNNATIFDRVDFVPTGRDSLHLDLFGARNWFQIPNSYDQLNQDQRQRATTLSIAPGYQHTIGTTGVFTLNPFFRQDRVDYFPSGDVFNDTPVSIAQNRHLTNFGVRADLAWVHGVHNVKVGVQVTQTQLRENFSLGVTDPLFNAVCVNSAGAALALPGVTNPNACGALGDSPNPALAPGLIPFDLTRGGSPFQFHGAANINQQAFYAQDQITLGNWTLNVGARFDNYGGLSKDSLLQPRAAVSYLFKPTSTVFRAAYTRSLETPYNENLVLSSETGSGGLAANAFGGVSSPLRAGHRDAYNAGFQQAIGKYLQIDASYFWKYTTNAYDFDTLLNTPIVFPISWQKSKLDGLSLRFSTPNLHGFQAFTTLGHTRARYFGPETGGLIFNSSVAPGVFRIDHDQAFQQTTDFRYQPKRNGPWFAFTWRYDSGEVAGAVATLQDVLSLTAAQQSAIGFFCGGDVATVYHAISSCGGSNYGAARVIIPMQGTYNADHNPPRVSPRNTFDVGVGTDNLFRFEKVTSNLKLEVVNLSNEASLYNFLSTFSGTHWLAPRTYQLTMGFAF